MKCGRPKALVTPPHLLIPMLPPLFMSVLIRFSRAAEMNLNDSLCTQAVVVKFVMLAMTLFLMVSMNAEWLVFSLTKCWQTDLMARRAPTSLFVLTSIALHGVSSGRQRWLTAVLEMMTMCFLGSILERTLVAGLTQTLSRL